MTRRTFFGSIAAFIVGAFAMPKWARPSASCPCYADRTIDEIWTGLTISDCNPPRPERWPIGIKEVETKYLGNGIWSYTYDIEYGELKYGRPSHAKFESYVNDNVWGF